MYRSVRLEQGLSIKKLSEKSGVSAQTIMRIEAGKYGTIANLARISEALGLGAPEVNFIPKEQE